MNRPAPHPVNERLNALNTRLGWGDPHRPPSSVLPPADFRPADVKSLFIIGAGGLGREVLEWIRAIPAHASGYRVSGFLDRNPDALAGCSLSLPILADPAGFKPVRGHAYACAIGDGSIRLELARGLAAPPGAFPTIVHPTARVARSACLGVGCIVGPGAIVSVHVRLGSFVVVNAHATIGHDAVIGDGVTLSCHADVTGGASLGDRVTLGSHATVLAGVRVCSDATVGAGSVAARDIQIPGSYLGVPARRIPGPTRSTPS